MFAMCLVFIKMLHLLKEQVGYVIFSYHYWCDMQVDHSDITASTRKWPKKVGDLPNKAQKLPSGPPGFLGLFISCIIFMWQCLRANQFAPFQECVVHPVFIFCLFFCKWGQKVWSARFWWVINKLEKPGGPLTIFMPYLADLLPFMVIFEQMLWCQSRPAAYHHVFCPLTFLVSDGNKLTQI